MAPNAQTCQRQRAESVSPESIDPSTAEARLTAINPPYAGRTLDLDELSHPSIADISPLPVLAYLVDSMDPLDLCPSNTSVIISKSTSTIIHKSTRMLPFVWSPSICGRQHICFLSWTKSENEVISQLQVPYIHHSDSFQFQHMKLLRECQIWSHFILQQSFWNLWSSIAAALRFPYIRTSSSKYTVDANSETAYIHFFFLSRTRIPLGEFVLFHIVSYY